jgi:hypothetical protein
MPQHHTDTPRAEQPQVEYRDVPGFPGYRVGDDESVWSAKITGAQGRLGEWFPLSINIDKDGYPYTTLHRGRPKRFHVHTLLLLAFVGPCPENMECRHLNGIAHDNRLSNICWGTPEENLEDKRRHGTVTAGSRNPKAKITEADIPEVRRRLAAGETQASIGRDLGITQSAVSDIKLRRRWGHVP